MNPTPCRGCLFAILQNIRLNVSAKKKLDLFLTVKSSRPRANERCVGLHVILIEKLLMDFGSLWFYSLYS